MQSKETRMWVFRDTDNQACGDL